MKPRSKKLRLRTQTLATPARDPRFVGGALCWPNPSMTCAAVAQGCLPNPSMVGTRG